MGALHEGHISLIKRARRENKTTVVSIFVNPTQFGPKEDLSRYPRPFKWDAGLLRNLKVDILFHPSVKEMYRFEPRTEVRVPELTRTLCGSPHSRGPAHFNGVGTVVAKLFNIIRPQKAYFGMKDFQQLRVIETMTRDLNFGIRIVRCPTVREKDGLALSSRNSYLSKAERASAPLFHRSLQQGRKLLRSRSGASPKMVQNKLKTLIKAIPGSKIDYLELVDPTTLQPKRSGSGPVLLAGAIWVGKTRLIDNILVQ